MHNGIIRQAAIDVYAVSNTTEERDRLIPWIAKQTPCDERQLTIAVARLQTFIDVDTNDLISR